MDSKFNPPNTQKEFEERAEKFTLKGGLAVINALRSRRASMVRAIDQEIEFYELAIDLKNKKTVDWPNRRSK